MKLPKYLHVEWDTKPTDFDKIGCDGLYVISVCVDWWGWFPLIVGNLAKRARESVMNIISK